MKKKELMKKWRSTQSAWDDHDFLAVKANPFMKLRWRRLNRRAAAEVAALAGRLGRGVDLVDVGCGHGDFQEWAGLSLRRYWGIEPSRALLPKDKRTPGGSLLRGQAEKLPLKSASADFVLVKEVLDHCFDPGLAIKEARRVLRPGGRLLVTLTNDQAWYKVLLPASAAKIKAGQHDHLFYFDPDAVTALLSAAGFKNIFLDSSHYLRLPGVAEKMLGALPERIGSALIIATDAVGSLILPDMGGSFWVSGIK